MEPVKVTIPILVSRTGQITTGWFTRKTDGKEHYEHDCAVDMLDEESYQAGFVVVHLEAVVDIDEVLKRLTVRGKVIG